MRIGDLAAPQWVTCMKGKEMKRKRFIPLSVAELMLSQVPASESAYFDVIHTPANWIANGNNWLAIGTT